MCDSCFGPRDIRYDYDGIKPAISRNRIAARPHHLWRYREILTVDGEPRVGLYSGFAPLVRADRLGAALGVRFTDSAGGTEVAVSKKLIEQGSIPRDESIVIGITGNKSLETVAGRAGKPHPSPLSWKNSTPYCGR